LENASFRTQVIGWVCRNLIHGTIVNSQSTAQQMSSKFKVPAEHIKVAYNGVGVLKDRQANDAVQTRKELGLYPDRKTIGIVARFDPVKRLDTLIKAAILLSDIPVQFLIVGDGQERTRLESMVETNGQTNRFIFVGNQKEPLRWISAFDIGVLCSESEGFPQAILEYMAMGLPVVASAVGGVSELVLDGETGFLVPSNDPAAFANALRSLIEDEKLSKQMGLAGQKRVREFFSLEKEISSHVIAYQSLINQGS
jgi:glycosyltransferase involved in cell wall biosynthesis